MKFFSQKRKPLKFVPLRKEIELIAG